MKPHDVCDQPKGDAVSEAALTGEEIATIARRTIDRLIETIEDVCGATYDDVGWESVSAELDSDIAGALMFVARPVVNEKTDKERGE
jgi:hypothetical protein